MLSPARACRFERRSAGFSLLELLIAMVVTMLVTGAVFGLMTAGQGAFRREPQLTDRQQSVRQAMAAIEDDIMRAGLGLPAFIQVFAPGLNAAGPAGVLTAGDPSDFLEFVAGDASCPGGEACIAPPSTVGAATTVIVPRVASCVEASLPGFLGFFDATGHLAVQPATVISSAVGCTAATAQLDLPIGRVPGTPVGNPAPPTFTPAGYAPVQLVRYEIAPCGDLEPDGAPTPCLYRSVTGRFDTTGAGVGGPPGPTWQVVARGIDDLQVQFRTGANPAPAPWADVPAGVLYCDIQAAGSCALANYNTIVRQVQVTLSARVTRGDLQGETRPVAGVPQRVRGQLSGVFTPRSALALLSRSEPSPLPLWQ